MEEKLINVIRKPDFNADLYGGFMFTDFQFMRCFPLNEVPLSETFDTVSKFLFDNGYDELSFDDFLPELSVTMDAVSLYADPYCNETDKQLILVIEKYSPTTNPIDQIILELLRFRNEREWEQFHNPKDLALAISIESAELLELFLWKKADEANTEKVKEELADIFSFAFLLAEKYGFDVKEIVLDKIKSNGEKYPVKKQKEHQKSMMNYNQDFEINKIAFNNNGLNSIQSLYFVSENWPVVYILNNNGVSQAYVGETIDTNSRIFTHLQTPSKSHLQEAHLISSRKFNKSVTLDIESNLIKYLHADGKYKLLNGNLGLVNHSYYQRDEFYWDMFKNIWNGLISNGIAQHSLEYISNSDLFKYSPYKTLSADQRKNLMLIIDALLSENKKSVLVEGGAGTGKTILAIFLFKLMLTSDEDFNYREFGEEEKEFIDKVKLLKIKFPNPKMGLVIAMGSFRKTIKKVFRNISGLNSNLVIGPSDLEYESYDILFVDESHRLRKRVNLGPYFAIYDRVCNSLGLDKLNTSELAWTQLRSNKVLYFYDAKQSIKPSDVDAIDFENLKNASNSINVKLHSQFRVKGGNGFVDFVNNLLDNTFKNKDFKYNDSNYDLLLFENFSDFVNKLREKNEKHQLSRFIAGYAWPWISQNDPSAFDIEIENIKLKWNSTAIDYINSDIDAQEVGCIHTTQGYDLNYAAIIFGPEIIYNPASKEIEIVKENYRDRNGTATIRDNAILKDYVINIYKTIMLRGILGCYIYVCDKNLRNYFKQHIYLFNENITPIIEIAESNEIQLIPFENSVPLYSLKVAAGEFKFNDRIPEEEFILVPDGVRITQDHFACRIIGNSMNKIVQDGQIALFKRYTGGSRNGLMVIAEYYDHQDLDYGSCYTFKEYFSQKTVNEESWQHEKIILKPKSFDTSYQDIVIDPNAINEKTFSVIGIFDRVIE